jgi:peptidoglycan/LPS O-acetylase OafA/YrhL
MSVYGQQTAFFGHADRLTVMAISARGDYFDRARNLAASICLAAAAAAIIGALLPWVTITPAPEAVGGIRNASEPFTGLEARDGWYVVAAAVAIAVTATLSVTTRRRGFVWLSMLASMLIGAVAIADLRAIEDTASAISRRMDIIGDADPSFGLWLVAAAGVVGLLGSVGLLTATPKPATSGSET